MARRAAGAVATVAALAGAAASGEVEAAPYSGLVVFGDSLSDTGNLGRYSNGPVWVERLADGIGVELRPSRQGGTNYAHGGALSHGGPRDVRSQAQTFLAAGRVDPDALYVVYGGANDLLAAGCVPNRDAAARNAAAALRATVDDLARAGAAHILVPNLADIGRAPVVRALGPACVAEARRLTRVFNDALDRELDGYERRSEARVQRLDVFALAEQVLADPAAAGFTDVTTPCMRTGCSGALFWDHLHPTTEAHARLAAAALDLLGIPPAE